MKHLLSTARAVGGLLIVGAATTSAAAQSAEPLPEVVRWRPDTLAMQVLSTVLFAGVGIVLAIVGFKLFDLVTPGKLQEEICEKQNVAAGILGAAIVLGISLIIAAAVY